MKISDIANITEAVIEGNPDTEISGIAKIEEAKENEITFIANPAYEKHYGTTRAGAVLTSENFKPSVPRREITLLRVKDPYNSFLKLLKHFEHEEISELCGISKFASVPENTKTGDKIFIDDFVKIGNGCRIGYNTKIFSNCSIGSGVKIGNNCIIYPNVTIYKKCIIGNNVIIHSGTAIGSDGFGQAKQKDGTYKKIPQLGIVKIEDDVEIGSNCSIDRATLGETLICRGVKLDNQIQIAHNVIIGDDTVIAAQVGIAGSTKIGKRCMIAGQAGIIGHLSICDDVILLAKTGVTKSITKPGMYGGYRCKPAKEAVFDEAGINKIPEIIERLKKLEKNK
ncbi:MAG: UDP-3-O-(3-hydroxymyristoyl)glucosamine N-acyltransferase [Ignavibacteria bacterium]|nr:UDP-3-O-(3-hydroxymyristoyl)glucosamine N-acyltransferase [Ignavibacteria bacterium]